MRGDGSRYDVIIIGSGLGGASAAHTLARKGLDVLVIERGDDIAKDYVASGRTRTYVTDLIGDRTKAISYLGGRTKFYGAALYRMRKSDFAETAHENGLSPAWPVSYDELDPYYEQAESLYRVHGSPENDPSEPARRIPYPFPPLPHADAMKPVVARLSRAGMQVAPQPRGVDHGPGGACIMCANCDGYYCPRDAKMDSEIAALRPAVATGRVEIAANTDCTRILTDQTGEHVRGVIAVSAGVEREIAADAVIVAAGIPGSALLLRRSRTAAHPEGLGNNHSNLGRYLAGHSTGVIFPFVSWRDISGVHTKTFAMNAFYDGDAAWTYPLGIIQIAGQMPLWKDYSRKFRPVIKTIVRHALTVFHMTEALPTPQTGITFDGDAIGSWTEPVHNLETYGELRKRAAQAFKRAGYPVMVRRKSPDVWHEVGTARMGVDPATSVVDPNGQVHGIGGLFVADASVLPSAGAVNTGLTIAALALSTADFVARGAGTPVLAAAS